MLPVVVVVTRTAIQPTQKPPRQEPRGFWVRPPLRAAGGDGGGTGTQRRLPLGPACRRVCPNFPELAGPGAPNAQVAAFTRIDNGVVRSSGGGKRRGMRERRGQDPQERREGP